MAVNVVHSSNDKDAQMLKTTGLTSNSWTITDGHLVVGDSYGSPEASFAPGHWFSIFKVEEDGDE